MRALAVLLPELDRLWGVPQRRCHPEVDTGVAHHAGARPGRAAAKAGHALGLPGARPGLKAHHARRRAAAIGHEQRGAKHAAGGDAGACPGIAPSWRSWWLTNTATSTAAWICRRLPCCACCSNCDALRKPEALPGAVGLRECDAGGAGGLRTRRIHLEHALQQALAVVLGVATGPIAAGCGCGEEGAAIGRAVDVRCGCRRWQRR